MAARSENGVNVLDDVRWGGEPEAVNVRIEPSDEPMTRAVGLLGDTWSAVTATGISMVWAVAILSESAWPREYRILRHAHIICGDLEQVQ
jgi:hypothetical protein